MRRPLQDSSKTYDRRIKREKSDTSQMAWIGALDRIASFVRDIDAIVNEASHDRHGGVHPEQVGLR